MKFLCASLLLTLFLKVASSKIAPIDVLANPRPVVIWHGMGDTCCYPFSMGAVKDEIERLIPGVYVYSVMIGGSIVEDEVSGFLGNANDQIDFVCQALKSNSNLTEGFNALGFSQGGQFLRGYVERCNDPPVYNLITMGSQHMGVADFPNCVSVNETICELVEELLSWGAYNEIVQENVIQAEYFRDPMDISDYLESCILMPDLNNEKQAKNKQYKINLETLNNLVLFMFENDTVVVPKESEWFGYYADGNINQMLTMRQLPIYTEDWIGLQELDKASKIQFGKVPGNHMQFTLDWFDSNVIEPYLMNSLEQ